MPHNSIWMHSRAGRQNPDEEKLPPPVTASPVIANQADDPQQNLQVLRDFNAQLKLKADQVTYRGMSINQLAVQASNQQGLMTVTTLSGKLASGDFSCLVRWMRELISR